MPLAVIQFVPQETAFPAKVHDLLQHAATLIDTLVEARHEQPIVGFVPSDFAQVYRALECVDRMMLAPGRRFVEWGSGVGVVTCLAAMLGFDAVGIEIEPELVEASRQLADEHGVEVQFVEGSLLPAGAERLLDRQGDIAWLRSDGPDAYAALDLEPDDFDVVFAYPWPGEEQIIFDLFDRYASTGAVLITFHGQEGIRMQRKMARR